MLRCDLYTRRDSHNLNVFNGWCLAASLAFVGARVALSEKYFNLHGPLAVAIVVVTIALLVMCVVMFLRFLREADELLRKIQLEAIGVGFGVGAVFMLGYRLCERLGALKL